MEEARDNSSMGFGNSQEQEGGYPGSTKRQKDVLFATLMDICHLKMRSYNPKLQKYKGNVVLRGDIVNDDSGSYAVFTEQGSSASQMTAAKIMDIISRIPGCSGQAADGNIRVHSGKNEGCSNIAQNSKVRVSRCLETSSTTQMSKIIGEI